MVVRARSGAVAALLAAASKARLAKVRALLTKRGRREQQLFLFEGPTLLREALETPIELEALYLTADALAVHPIARECVERGVRAYCVEPGDMRKISDVTTPSGIVGVAPIRLLPLETLFAERGPLLVLGALNDPGNAGTLVRVAEAFRAAGVIFGHGGVEPYHPKVVRSAMGSLFRMRLADATPDAFRDASEGWQTTCLEAGGAPLSGLGWSDRVALIVGSERQGLGAWKAACSRSASVPMRGPVESLNAAVAGAIALYEVTRRSGCQDSVQS